LKVEILRNFSILFDLFLPIAIAIITGLVVGISVGLVIRKRQLKDFKEQQNRNDKVRAADELIKTIIEIQTLLSESTSYMLNELEKGDKLKFANDYIKSENMAIELKNRLDLFELVLSKTIFDQLKSFQLKLSEFHQNVLKKSLLEPADKGFNGMAFHMSIF